MLALFRSPAELTDPDLFAAVDEIEKQVLAEDDASVVHPWSLEEMASAGFVDITQQDLPCLVTTTATDFVGRLATVSAYLMLSPGERADALRQIRAVLDE